MRPKTLNFNPGAPNKHKPGDKASFEPLKTKVYNDWKNQTAAELSTKAIREMGKKYKIIDQGAKQ